MAYKNNISEISMLSHDKFLEIIKKIENAFNDEVAKNFSGQEIYVTLPELYDASYFVNTTVSDLISVCGEKCLGANLLSYMSEKYRNMSVFSVKMAGKKDFRNELKFTPNNTLKVVFKTICPDGVHADMFPALQNEKYLKEECKKAFDSNEENVDYDEIMENSISILYHDKRFSNIKIEKHLIGDGMGDLKRRTAEYIAMIDDIESSWGITYLYKNILFIFPVNQKSYKSVFENREKIDGRKRQLPVVVKSHERKNGQMVDSHLRMSHNTVVVDGREFSFLIGGEDISKMFPDTDKSKKRLKRFNQNLQKEENSRFYYL